jgi:hypothetical protein
MTGRETSRERSRRLGRSTPPSSTAPRRQECWCTRSRCRRPHCSCCLRHRGRRKDERHDVAARQFTRPSSQPSFARRLLCRGKFGLNVDSTRGTSQDVPTESCAAVPASPSSLNDVRVARRAVSSLNEPPLSASGGSKCLGGSALGPPRRRPDRQLRISLVELPLCLAQRPRPPQPAVGRWTACPGRRARSRNWAVT